jgi:hypothetical protein
MTNDRTAKKAAREHAAKTGMSFTAARRATRDQPSLPQSRPLASSTIAIGRRDDGSVVSYSPREDYLLRLLGAEEDQAPMLRSLAASLADSGYTTRSPDSISTVNAALKSLFEAATERRALLLERGVDDIGSLPAEAQPERTVILIPEMPAAVRPFQMPANPTAWEQRDHDAQANEYEALRNISDLIARTARTGRAVGISIIMAVDNADGVGPYAELVHEAGRLTFTRLAGGEPSVLRPIDESVLPTLARMDSSLDAPCGDVLRFGISGATGSAHLNRRVSGGVLIGGYAGSGKTIVLRSLATEAVRAGDNVIIFDLVRNGTDFAPFIGHAVLAVDDETAADAVRQISRTVIETRDLLVRHGVDRYEQLPDGVRPARTLVVVEAWGPSRGDDSLSSLEKELRRLSMYGGHGITVAVAAQQAGMVAERVDPSRVMDRLVLRNGEIGLQQSIFTDRDRANATARPGAQGRGVLETTDGRFTAVQCFISSDEEIEEMLAR